VRRRLCESVWLHSAWCPVLCALLSLEHAHTHYPRPSVL
jgi:hypothetical protein